MPAWVGSIWTSATCRPPLLVPHQAEMKLLTGSVSKLRLLEPAVDEVTAVSSEKYTEESALAR